MKNANPAPIGVVAFGTVWSFKSWKYAYVGYSFNCYWYYTFSSLLFNDFRKLSG